MLPRLESRPTNFTSVEISNDSESAAGVGGRVVRMTANAALEVGDAVYQTATAGEVDKSVTAADYTKFVGIVVGGRQTDNRALHGSGDVGLAAAAANESVLVQIEGHAWAVAGVALATVGTLVGPDTSVAGEVASGATAIAGQILGHTASAATEGSAVKLFIRHR